MRVSVRRLSFDEVVDQLIQIQVPYHRNYLAMYSSWYGGVITDPGLMMVPIDDHLVHRGDGVFEAFKCVGGNIYALNRHLDRMESSAQAVSLALPVPRSELVEVILATVRIAGACDCLLRLFVSRGPGGFSTNPYECPASQLYVVVTRLDLPPPHQVEQGVSLKSSRIPIKKAYLATIKSCNYLPNVLMKKEAEDAGVNYTLSIDEQGFIGEGSTENIGIITKQKEFLVPRFDAVLRGTTVTRIMELAGSLVAEGTLSRIAEAQITVEQASEAAELMVFGTTFDVLPVVQYDGRRIGGGKPGPIFHRFLQLLRDDMRFCAEMLTPVTG
jgi:branched-subunit amino acid aminotransferase/4-amino-4-deoxychorismate lyase